MTTKNLRVGAPAAKANDKQITTRSKTTYVKDDELGWIGESFEGKDGKAYVRTPYYLNTKSSIQPTGVQLSWGVAEHEVWLNILLEASTSEVNAHLESIGEAYQYVTRAGESNSQEKALSALEQIKARRNAG